MTNPVRIKGFTFPQCAGSATTVFQYTEQLINGEILRVFSPANFTGSIILAESGALTSGLRFCNFTVTSGTNSWGNQNFTNTTGSFCTNSPLMLMVGSLSSGTSVVYGPVTVLYR
jgi:hypothetical protein